MLMKHEYRSVAPSVRYQNSSGKFATTDISIKMDVEISLKRRAPKPPAFLTVSIFVSVTKSEGKRN